MDHDGVVRFGLVGSADIIGIAVGGRFLAIEVKTGDAVQSKQQKNFERMITDFFGVYILTKSVHHVMVVLDDWAKEYFRTTGV